jgi:periplasmic protein TonB
VWSVTAVGFFCPMLLEPSTRRSVARSAGVSTVVHLSAVVAILGYVYRHPASVVNPSGMAAGKRIDLVYLPGRAPASTLFPVAKLKPAAVARPTPSSAPALPALPLPPLSQVTLTPAAPTAGDSTSPPSDATDRTKGSNSWGQEDAQQIALTTYSPSPTPDLSVLPRGVQGDVILDVTINTNGRISDLTVVKTMGYGIEMNVIDTVRTWTFQPATREGLPVASVQEILFHFRWHESPYPAGAKLP